MMAYRKKQAIFLMYESVWVFKVCIFAFCDFIFSVCGIFNSIPFCASEFQIFPFHTRIFTWFYNQLTAFISYYTNRLISIEMYTFFTKSTEEVTIWVLIFYFKCRKATFIIKIEAVLFISSFYYPVTQLRQHLLYHWALLLYDIFIVRHQFFFYFIYSSVCFVFFSSSHKYTCIYP